MDFKRLTHFIALAEERRFVAAAARVNLSPAAFSRSIQSLEDTCGTRLFDRGVKGSQLTKAGEFVLQRARSLSLDIQSLERELQLMKSGDVGEITMGFAPAPAATMAPSMLCELHKQSPNVVARLVMGDLPNLLLQLDSQKLDFCIGDARMLGQKDQYEMEHIGKVYGALYCRKEHPLSNQSCVGVEELSLYRIARISVSHFLGSYISKIYGFADEQSFPLAIECDDASLLTHIAMNTNVIGLLPVSLADNNPGLTKLMTTNVQDPFAEVSAIWLKDRTLAPSANRAIQITREIFMKDASASKM